MTFGWTFVLIISLLMYAFFVSHDGNFWVVSRRAFNGQGEHPANQSQLLAAEYSRSGGVIM